nr:hypothetical protein [Nocardia otitidiscaviarum]
MVGASTADVEQPRQPRLADVAHLPGTVRGGFVAHRDRRDDALQTEYAEAVVEQHRRRQSAETVARLPGVDPDAHLAVARPPVDTADLHLSGEPAVEFYDGGHREPGTGVGGGLQTLPHPAGGTVPLLPGLWGAVPERFDQIPVAQPDVPPCREIRETRRPQHQGAAEQVHGAETQPRGRGVHVLGRCRPSDEVLTAPVASTDSRQ